MGTPVKMSFEARAETFGLLDAQPWALPALRLLCNVPRAYLPLIDAWELRYPGSKRALARLGTMGFATFQPAVIIDTRTAELAERCGPRVRRFRTTARGHRLAEAVAEDLRVLSDTFPAADEAVLSGVARLLLTLDVEDSHARYGLSLEHITSLSGLPKSTAQWWTRKLISTGHVRLLDLKLADVREVVPAHWRVGRLLFRQLRAVVEAYPDRVPASLTVELRAGRDRFLDDIDPKRLGISGATDFDHDVDCQRVLAALLSSPRAAVDGIFALEPRFVLPIRGIGELRHFDPKGRGELFYQPDAEMRERDGLIVRRSVVEYERYQSRRDAWSHIERWLGWLHLRTLPFEGGVLRFVVESEARLRTYVELMEAFADYTLDHPERLPANASIIIAASTIPRIVASADPLDDRAWFRVVLGRGPAGCLPVLHDVNHSPYNDYFSRAPS